MPTYRLYAVDSTGRFLGPERALTASNDREAFQQVVEHSPEPVWGVEIWDGDRLAVLGTLRSENLRSSQELLQFTTHADRSRGHLKRPAQKRRVQAQQTG